MTGGDIEPDQLADVPDALPKVFAELWSVTWLASRAFEIATALRHPVYHCFYLALVESEDALLVTADRRLIGRVAGSPWESRCRPLVP